MPICDRCKKTSLSLIMSRFNIDMICDDCEDKEKKHPAYAKAVKAELNAVKSGNYNFLGIGKPRDL